jgi:DNA-binding NarL/FixJ family response regulator
MVSFKKSNLSSFQERIHIATLFVTFCFLLLVARLAWLQLVSHNKYHLLAESNRIAISETQAEILRLLAEGYTNAAIAVRRGTSLRATEALVQRTFSTLGLKNDEDFNPRVLAVRMWQEDKVVIR